MTTSTEDKLLRLTDEQIMSAACTAADELDATRVSEMRDGKWHTTTIFDGDTGLIRFGRLVEKDVLAQRLPTEQIDVERIKAWAYSRPSKQANAAFTAGAERQIAYMIEDAAMQAEHDAARDRLIAADEVSARVELQRKLAELRQIYGAACEHLQALGEKEVPLVPSAREPTDADVEAVETAVGMGHAAWDTIDPKEIIKAARSLK